MTRDITAPMLGAKRLNERTERLTERYDKTLQMFLKAFMQDGFLPGTVPPRNKVEEYATLLPEYDYLLATAQDVNLPQGRRTRAQQQLQRLFQLEQDLASERGPTANQQLMQLVLSGREEAGNEIAGERS